MQITVAFADAAPLAPRFLPLARGSAGSMSSKLVVTCSTYPSRCTGGCTTFMLFPAAGPIPDAGA
jgi:hypothetical protein